MRGRCDRMREENALSHAWGNCPACGYNNAPYESRCEKCGRRIELTGIRRMEAERESGTHTISSADPESRIHAVGKPPAAQSHPPSRPNTTPWSPRPGMPAQGETR